MLPMIFGSRFSAHRGGGWADFVVFTFKAVFAAKGDSSFS